MRPFEGCQWLPETVTQLRELWPLGLSHAVMAERLGVSKNAISGKAHRIGLPPRINPAFPTVPPGTRGERSHKAPEPEGKPLLAIDRKPPEAPKSRPGVALPQLYQPVRECAWPLNSGRPWKFCEAPTVPGRMYCGDHCKAASGKPVPPMKAA